MSCAHGCQDGELWTREPDGTERVRLCVCQRGRSEFRDGYSPGGINRKAQFRRLQRARARRSVVKRRQLAAGRPPRRRERTRPIALARAYPRVAQLSRAQFDAAYEDGCRRLRWKFDQRGLNTAAELHAVLWLRYRVDGQDFELTNGQLQAALAARGRPRSRRTVQLTRKRLEALGLFSFTWVKRGTWQRDRGWCAGERADTIRVTVLHVRRANCTPPTGAGASLLRRSASRSPDPKMNAHPPPNDQIPPATPADDNPPCGGNDPITWREELERAIAFAEAKVAAGWSSPTIAAELRRLRQELRLSASGQSNDRMSSSSAAGLRRCR